jgi:hypothetical protein
VSIVQLTITSVDHAPEELHEQTPLVVDLLRELPGPDRPDYWLGRVVTPIRWIDQNIERTINHVIVSARWEGTRIEPNVTNLPVGIRYVTDASQLEDPALDFAKCRYVAIGLAHAKPKALSDILAGIIRRAFGVGRSS